MSNNSVPASPGWVYTITCTSTGKFYVGSTTNKRGPYARWDQHKALLESKKHPNRYLQNAWNKRGGINFIFSIIDSTEASLAFSLEQHYLDTLKPQFNLALFAGTVRGVKHSPEVGKRHSLFMTGRKLTEEHKRKVSQALKGKSKPPRTKEHTEKIANSRRGKKMRPRTEEHKRNIGLARKGEKSNFYGKSGKLSAVSTPVKDSNGVLYDSQRHAASALGIGYKGINKVLRGERSHYRGYRFEYA